MKNNNLRGTMGMINFEASIHNFIYYFCRAGLFLVCLLSLGFLTSCSDSGGGGGKYNYQLFKNDIKTEFPWFVNVTYQVNDEKNQGVSGISTSVFQLTEDGKSISQSRSEATAFQRSTLPSGYTYRLNTVLLLDNTPSQSGNLEVIKDAAQSFLDNIDDSDQQYFAIMAFDESGDPKVITDFSQEYINIREGIESIEATSGTSDIYGAVKEGLSLWDEDYDPSDKTITQGVLVVLTDGNDTSDLNTIGNAIKARGNKKIVTVALGDDIPSNVIENLKELGNLLNAGEDGFYQVSQENIIIPTDDKSKKNSLRAVSKIIQEEVQEYADSFYWLRYKSDARSTDQATNHQFALSVNNNKNKTETASFTGTFSSTGFIPKEGGVYLNSDSSDPDGINGVNSESPDLVELSFDPDITDNPKFLIKARTLGDNMKTPEYNWISSNTDIVDIEEDVDDNSKANLIPKGFGTTQIRVIDVANNDLSITIDVNVQKGSLSVNATESNPDGLKGIGADEPDTIELNFDPINDIVDETFEIRVATFGDNQNPPDYQYTSLDSNVVTIEKQDDETALITSTGLGETRIIIKDLANNQEISILVDVEGVTGGFMFEADALATAYPWYVSALFHVKDIYDRETTNLLIHDFVVTETNSSNHSTVMNSNTTELNIRKHNDIPLDSTYTLKTVLLIDKTPSVGMGNLEEIKQAAVTMIEDAFSGSILSSEGNYQQEIGVWAYYSDQVEMVHNFSQDPESLTTAIEAIEPNYASVSDLYGAIIKGMSYFENDYSPYDGNNALQEGAVVVLTDGYDTLGFRTFEEARNARNAANKQIITVGIGDAVAGDNVIRNNLAELGNLLYMLVPNPQEIVQIEKIYNNKGEVIKEIPITLLETTLSTVQKRLEDFADSFYWIEYKSPLVGNIMAPTDFTLSVSIANNDNPDSDSVLESPFSKEDFFVGEPGVYVNSSATNPAGITGTLELLYYDEAWDDLFPQTFQTLKALTIMDGYWNSQSAYSWSVAASQVIDLDVNPINSSLATVKVSDTNRQEIGSSMLVEDLDNGYFSVINVATVENVLPYPVMTAYYPFNGNANDESGNNYHGVVFGPTLTADRYGKANKAYLFGGNSASDFIAIRDLHYNQVETIDEITVCAWVQTTSEEPQSIVAFDRSEYWALRIQQGKLMWSLSSASGSWPHLEKRTVDMESPNKINNGQWHFVCGTFKRGFEVDSKLYVDGILVSALNAFSDTPLGNSLFPRYGYIGAPSESETYDAQKIDENTINGYYFDGKIDDVIILEKALTEDQISYLYNAVWP